MDKEKLKEKCDLNRIEEFIDKDGGKWDYIRDIDGNYIIRLTPLEVKLIEKIKELESRIKELEK